MKLSVKIPIFAIAIIIASVLVTAGVSIVENAAYNSGVGYERVGSASQDLKEHIQQMLEDSRKNAVSLSQNYRLVDALSSGDFEGMKAVLDELNLYLKADTISVTDAEGNVAIRQHEPEKLGDSILKQANVQRALEGEVLTTLEPGALVKLSCRTGAPVRDGSGQIIGTVVTGYTLENSDALDALKELHHTELSVFSGTGCIATTLTENGERAVGAQLDEAVAKTVLEDGQPYSGDADISGRPYIAEYDPLLDSEGKVVGAIFAGLSKADAAKAARDTVLHLGLTSLAIIAVCCLLIMRFVNRTIKRPMRALAEASGKLARGELDVEIGGASGGKRDEISELAGAMDEMALRLRSYILDISRVLSSMSEDDFTVKSSVEYMGDFASIGRSLEKISDSFNRTLSAISAAAGQVGTGAELVAGGAQNLASGSSEQAATVEELNASIERIAEHAEQNSASVRTAAEHVEQAAAGLQTGNEQMDRLARAVEDIRAASDQIVTVTKVVEDIAFQTNILALNAAVEAVRAGSAGRGFAVVADEVRNLAAKSAEAARQTGALIQTSVAAVENGAEMTEKTARILRDVGAKASKITEGFGQIERASAEQASAIAQIREGVARVSSVVQTTAATAQENSAASEEMSAQAAALREEAGKFKLDAGAGDFPAEAETALGAPAAAAPGLCKY